MGVRFVDGGDDQTGAAGAVTEAAPEAPAADRSSDASSNGQRSAAQNGDHGFPPATPLAEMTVEQREAYWKHQAKQHETKWKKVRDSNLTPDQVIEMQQQLDDLNRERMTDHQKAVEDAKKTAAAETAARYAPRLARAAVEAALARAGVAGDRIDSEVEWMDLSKFLTPKGDVDADKVSQFAESRRPPKEDTSDPVKKKFPDMGGGKRGPATESAKARADQVARARGWVRDDNK